MRRVAVGEEMPEGMSLTVLSELEALMLMPLGPCTTLQVVELRFLWTEAGAGLSLNSGSSSESASIEGEQAAELSLSSTDV